MDPRLLGAFQDQVYLQCEWVLAAWKEVNAGLAENNTMRVFYGVQNLLTAAANISKAFWGQGGKKSMERAPLRHSLEVRDDSPLRDPDMRNNYDHYDNRLDMWLQESKQHINVDLNVGPAHLLSVSEPIDMFRNYDPVAKSALFWGDEFNLQAIVDEVNRLLARLKEAERKPGPSP